MAAYTAEDIARFRAKAFLLKFEVSPTYYTRSLEEMLVICNGVGGRGNFLNPVINFVYSNFQASSTGHDEEYFLGGSGVDRLIADRRFKRNMLREWKKNYSWIKRLIRPKAREEKLLITAAYGALRLMGHNYFNYISDEEREKDTPKEAKE